MASEIGSSSLDTSSRPLLVMSTWSQVTLASVTPGIRISTSSGDTVGIPVIDAPISLLLGPRDTLYARSIYAGAIVSYCVQPLPWIERTILGAARALGF